MLPAKRGGEFEREAGKSVPWGAQITSPLLSSFPRAFSASRLSKSTMSLNIGPREMATDNKESTVKKVPKVKAIVVPRNASKTGISSTKLQQQGSETSSSKQKTFKTAPIPAFRASHKTTNTGKDLVNQKQYSSVDSRESLLLLLGKASKQKTSKELKREEMVPAQSASETEVIKGNQTSIAALVNKKSPLKEAFEQKNSNTDFPAVSKESSTLLQKASAYKTSKTPLKGRQTSEDSKESPLLQKGSSHRASKTPLKARKTSEDSKESVLQKTPSLHRASKTPLKMREISEDSKESPLLQKASLHRASKTPLKMRQTSEDSKEALLQKAPSLHTASKTPLKMQQTSEDSKEALLQKALSSHTGSKTPLKMWQTSEDSAEVSLQKASSHRESKIPLKTQEISEDSKESLLQKASSHRASKTPLKTREISEDSKESLLQKASSDRASKTPLKTREISEDSKEYPLLQKASLHRPSKTPLKTRETFEDSKGSLLQKAPSLYTASKTPMKLWPASEVSTEVPLQKDSQYKISKTPLKTRQTSEESNISLMQKGSVHKNSKTPLRARGSSKDSKEPTLQKGSVHKTSKTPLKTRQTSEESKESSSQTASAHRTLTKTPLKTRQTFEDGKEAPSQKVSSQRGSKTPLKIRQTSKDSKESLAVSKDLTLKTNHKDLLSGEVSLLKTSKRLIRPHQTFKIDGKILERKAWDNTISEDVLMNEKSQTEKASNLYIEQVGIPEKPPPSEDLLAEETDKEENPSLQRESKTGRRLWDNANSRDLLMSEKSGTEEASNTRREQVGIPDNLPGSEVMSRETSASEDFLAEEGDKEENPSLQRESKTGRRAWDNTNDRDLLTSDKSGTEKASNIHREQVGIPEKAENLPLSEVMSRETSISEDCLAQEVDKEGKPSLQTESKTGRRTWNNTNSRDELLSDKSRTEKASVHKDCLVEEANTLPLSQHGERSNRKVKKKAAMATWAGTKVVQATATIGRLIEGKSEIRRAASSSQYNIAKPKLSLQRPKKCYQVYRRSLNIPNLHPDSPLMLRCRFRWCAANEIPYEGPPPALVKPKKYLVSKRHLLKYRRPPLPPPSRKFGKKESEASTSAPRPRSSSRLFPLQSPVQTRKYLVSRRHSLIIPTPSKPTRSTAARGASRWKTEAVSSSRTRDPSKEMISFFWLSNDQSKGNNFSHNISNGTTEEEGEKRASATYQCNSDHELQRKLGTTDAIATETEDDKEWKNIYPLAMESSTKGKSKAEAEVEAEEEEEEGSYLSTDCEELEAYSSSGEGGVGDNGQCRECGAICEIGGEIGGPACSGGGVSDSDTNNKNNGHCMECGADLKSGRGGTWGDQSRAEENKAERLKLRRMRERRRRMSGKFMLDSALGHAVQKLAPHGDVKVKVLVEAYETVFNYPVDLDLDLNLDLDLDLDHPQNDVHSEEEEIKFPLPTTTPSS